MSRYRIGVNAGPVHVSRRMGGNGKGCLTQILSWFIVTPFRILAVAFGPHRARVRQAPVVPTWPPPIVWPSPGLYMLQNGRVMYWDGTRWFG